MKERCYMEGKMEDNQLTAPAIADRIGVCSWSLQPGDGEALRGMLRGLPFKSVQLALTPMVLEPSGWNGVIESLASDGVSVVSGMFGTLGEDYSTLESIAKTGGVFVDELWEQNYDLARKVADLAGEKRIERVSFHAGFIPHDNTDPRFGKLRDRLVALADLFARAGCMLLMETGQETAESLELFLENAGHPNLAVNFDPANMILYRMGDPIAALRRLGQRVEQIHLKDACEATSPGAWGNEVPLGRGDVDWREFLEVVRAINYRGHYMIEREAGDDRSKDIIAARDYVLTTFAGCGQEAGKC